MHSELEARYELARVAAVEAGELTLEYYRGDHQVQRKTDGSPVTVADREAEQLLRKSISAAFPRDGILGEEFGTQEGSSGYRWIIDPIDGTKSFISGVPLYGTMVAVEHQGRCPVGVVYFPALGQIITACHEMGAWHGPPDGPHERARVSQARQLVDGLFVTSEVGSFADRGAADAFDRLQRRCWITRTWGDCYGYYLVATGKALVMADPVMSVWDAAALQPIMIESGGTFTDWQGNPTIHAGEGLGTNARVLDEVLAILRG